MTKQQMSASNDKKLDFLQNVLEAAEKRRESVENKSSILLASNAILLTAMASFGFPTPFISSAPSAWLWFKFGLAFLSLSGIAISSLCAVQVLAPVTPKRRMQVMKVSANEFNVFFVAKLPSTIAHRHILLILRG